MIISAKEREGHADFPHCFTLQMTIKARTGPSQSQRLWCLPRGVLPWAQALGSSFAAFPGTLAGSWHKPATIQVASITGRSFMCYATILVSKRLKFYQLIYHFNLPSMLMYTINLQVTDKTAKSRRETFFKKIFLFI